MRLQTAIFMFTLLGTAVLRSQPVSYEDFKEQRLAEQHGKMEAFRHKTTIQNHYSQNTDQQNYDVTYYKLDLIIEPSTSLLSGTVTVEGKSRIPSLQTIVLDFAENMDIRSVTCPDTAAFSREGDQLILSLRNPLTTGEQFRLQIEYSGTPQQGGFGGFVFDSQNGQSLIWTLSEPYYARSWWPCKDVPNDKADSVDIVVTVPATLFAASNGNLVSESDNGDGTKTFHWQVRYPITTYLVSLAITNYARFSQWFRYSPTDSMEITNYVFQSNLNAARNGLATLPDMLDFFHRIFGPYPFIEEKYGIAQFGWSGGMEHQTLSSQGGFGQVLNVHELAHQWWGDMITNANWSEIWLNEGFASYSEALYFEHVRGREYYHQYMSWMDWNFPGPIYRYDTTSVSSLFTGIVYDKGAWVLHMLRHVVGDSNFFDILQAYAADSRFKYGNATTDGFKDVCETVSGLDLDQFFEQWIFGTVRPHYQYVWGIQTGDGEDARVDVSIEQLQVTEDRLYEMPIDILFENTSRDTIVSVYNDAAYQNFLVELPFVPTNVTLDPDGWILKQVEPFTPDEDIPNDYTLMQNYPNPFNTGTTVSFSLKEPISVEVKIFNIAGQLVRTLASGYYSAGTHRLSWDGTNENGEALSSGVYIYRLLVSDFTETRKLVLIK